MSSILGSNGGNMGSPFFNEFKKQASFFLKEKIKTARLALTDVTPAQLLVEEATNGNPGAPDTCTLKLISRAAFEVDDYWRIVEILHKRLVSFDRRNWRASYQALIVLEHLLTHGPERVSEEFQNDRDVVEETGSFLYVDEKGFNWGLNVRKKSERILKLLDDRSFLKEERNKARTVTKGIEGFGSFCNRRSSDQEVPQESSLKSFEKCNSQFNEHGNKENGISLFDDQYFTNGKLENSKQANSDNSNLALNTKLENSTAWKNSDNQRMLEKDSARTSFKENTAPKQKVYAEDLDDWDTAEESNALLSNQEADSRMNISMEDDHPFNLNQLRHAVSLLPSRDQVLRAF
ncbi:uncharacterized protein [Coffea arabica]|uniref:ENTH domain-containing protein n=1 Tax=Coffea arabica TaxID=13443 RepID=A0A6P6U8J2_COFAR|nr:epsin-3-like [Coffea arabica]